MIGSKVVEILFENKEPMGAWINVSGIQYRVVGVFEDSGGENEAEATVTVERDGSKETFSASGDGMVHAIFAALRDAFAVADARLLDYRVEPVSKGADAMAEVNVLVQVRERTFTGTGTSTDIVEASARSFTSALNKATRVSAY